MNVANPLFRKVAVSERMALPVSSACLRGSMKKALLNKQTFGSPLSRTPRLKMNEPLLWSCVYRDAAIIV